MLRKAPAPVSSISLLSFEDNYLTLHGGPRLLTDPKEHGRKIPVWGQAKEVKLGEAKHISLRPLLDGDRLAGIWEFDPETGTVVYGTFDPLPAARRKAVAQAADDVARFIADELGHARSFSLDTMDEVRKRAALVKAIASRKN